MITAKLKDLGISMGTHDDPGVPIGGGFRKTSRPHTFIIPQSKTEGLSGYGLPMEQLTDEHGNPIVPPRVDETDQLFPDVSTGTMPIMEATLPAAQSAMASPVPTPAPVPTPVPIPAPIQAPIPVLADLLLDIPGVGEFPCVYRYVRYGTGCIILGLLEKKSFLPKKWEPRTEPSPVRVVGSSKFYFYTGMLFSDGVGNAAVLVELPEQKEEEQNA